MNSHPIAFSLMVNSHPSLFLSWSTLTHRSFSHGELSPSLPFFMVNFPPIALSDGELSPHRTFSHSKLLPYRSISHLWVLRSPWGMNVKLYMKYFISWTVQMWNQVSYDPRSYECNLCNFVLILEVENELDKLVKHGVIKKTNKSCWASPTVGTKGW